MTYNIVINCKAILTISPAFFFLLSLECTWCLCFAVYIVTVFERNCADIRFIAIVILRENVLKVWQLGNFWEFISKFTVDFYFMLYIAKLLLYWTYVLKIAYIWIRKGLKDETISFNCSNSQNTIVKVCCRCKATKTILERQNHAFLKWVRMFYCHKNVLPRV